MKRVSVLLTVILILAVLITGCGGNEQDAESTLPEEIRIGVFEPLTGADAAAGECEKNGIDLAHALYPSVTIKGTEIPVVLQYADNKSDNIESAAAARNLADDFGAHIVLGSFGSLNSIAAGPVFSETEVPAIGTSCTNPLVTIGNDYYFRVCAIDPYQGKVMASYAFDGGFNKIAIIQEASDYYSSALAGAFSETMAELTGDEDCITSVSSYNAGDNDFNAQLTAIRNSDADAIFAAGNFRESALIMKQARELGIILPFLGNAGWEEPKMLKIAGKAAEGAAYFALYDSSAVLTSRTNEFLDVYSEKFGKDIKPDGVTALAFDAYLLAIDTIEKTASVNGSALRDTIAKTKDFEGATGYITIDENGDAVKPAIIKAIQNGKPVYKSTVEPL